MTSLSEKTQWAFTNETCTVRVWRPTAASTELPSREAVLCLHGVESHSEWFQELAAALTPQGFSLFAYDRPGWGESLGERGHLDSYADALRQVAEAATRLREVENFTRVHLLGLSWGGLLALYAALRRGALFDSLTLVAPGICPRTNLSLLKKLRVVSDLLSKNKQARIPLDFAPQDFTRRVERQTYIANDPLRTTAVSASFCLETLKMRKFCTARLRERRLLPTTILLAEDDVIVDNTLTAELFTETRRVGEPHHSKPWHGHLAHEPSTSSLRKATADSARVAVETIPAAAHSLIFEAPTKVAEAVVRTAKQGGELATQRHQVVVLGAGAVGSLVGGLLALGGHEVTLIGRRAHVEAVNTHGLQLQLGAGRRTIRDHLRAVETVAEISAPPDLIIIAVKSFATETTAKEAATLVGANTAILSLQNGTENEERIRQACPQALLLGGAISAYVEFTEPGKIIWHDDRGGLAASMYAAPTDADSREVADAAAEKLWNAILPATGMSCLYVSGDSTSLSVKWSKLLLNVAFNALNAVTGLPASAILAHPEHGRLAVEALKEGFCVMAGAGIEPVDLPGYPVRRLAKLCRLPVSIVQKILAWQTAHDTKGVSSMAQDLRRGRALTEIDEINGTVVRAGPAVGVDTPANKRLCQLVREAAQG